jgi:hypothetical protein
VIGVGIIMVHWAASDSPFTISGDDEFVNPVISVSPTSHDFGSIDAGSSSSSKTFIVSNTGNADLVIGTISITGTNSSEFSKQNDTCSNKTITSSGTCTIELVFTPTSEGLNSANIEIPSNDSDTPILHVPLSGDGVSMDIVHVDFTYTGTESGTQSQPYNTLAEAINAVAVGGEIIIKGGITNETFTGINKIDKEVTIKSSGGTATIGKQ